MRRGTKGVFCRFFVIFGVCSWLFFLCMHAASDKGQYKSLIGFYEWQARHELIAKDLKKRMLEPTFGVEPFSKDLVQTIAGCRKFAQRFCRFLETSLRVQGLSNEQVEHLQNAEETKQGILIEDSVLYSAIKFPEDAKIEVFGDLHGDFGPIESLLINLLKNNLFDPETFRILDPNTYYIFLGDVIDRGTSGLLNLFYIAKLMAANPGRVWYIRGNHEKYFNDGCCSFKYDLQELPVDGEFLEDAAEELFQLFFNKIFVLLPQVLFVTTSKARFAFLHGGIDHQMTEEMKNGVIEGLSKTVVEGVPYSWIVHQDECIFPPTLWNDMHYEAKLKTIWGHERGSYMLGCSDVINWMMRFMVTTIFRGHQQEDIVADGDRLDRPFSAGKWCGIATRWQDRVITLNVAPNTGVYNESPDYFCDIGTWARVYRAPELFIDPPMGSNEIPHTLETAPEYVLEPVYFDPRKHTIIPPEGDLLNGI